jgi:ubiquinone/menaquinone biosynthesis C-methylase UbiE
MEELLSKFALHLNNNNRNILVRDDFVKDVALTIPCNHRVLDVGSGTKPYKYLFSHCLYTSHEFADNKNIIDTTRNETTHTLKQHDIYSDILNIPVEDNYFDFILCTEVFEHIPEPIRAMKELVRICKPTGKILITAPFTSGIHQEPYHFYSGFSPYFYDYLKKIYNLKVVQFKNQGNMFLLQHQEILRLMKYIADDISNSPNLLNAYNSIETFLMSYTLYLNDQVKTDLMLYDSPDKMLDTLADINKFSIGYCVLFEKQ